MIAIKLTEEKTASLQALAACGEQGTSSMMTGPLNGASLAALVQFELADRAAAGGRLGGWRYRINASGLRHLAQGGRPRGHTSVMSNRDPAADDVDFFPTPPWGARAGAELVKRLDPTARSVWEPACGAGHLVHGLRDYFPIVRASDAYLYDDNRVFDFLSGPEIDVPFVADWIITNPPFAAPEDFIRKAWRRSRRGCAMLLRTNCLEGVERDRLFYEELRLTGVATFAERLPMVRGRWDPDISSASSYSWFIFQKHLRRAPLNPPHYRIPVGTRARLTAANDEAFAMREAA